VRRVLTDSVPARNRHAAPSATRTAWEEETATLTCAEQTSRVARPSRIALGLCARPRTAFPRSSSNTAACYPPSFGRSPTVSSRRHLIRRSPVVSPPTERLRPLDEDSAWQDPMRRHLDARVRPWRVVEPARCAGSSVGTVRRGGVCCQAPPLDVLPRADRLAPPGRWRALAFALPAPEIATVVLVATDTRFPTDYPCAALRNGRTLSWRKAGGGR
jgi:hypothetical protein